jgi:class 3 adenylate cyclase
LAREHLVRRLVAIFAADVAGYSRLSGLDEEGTHAQLQDHLRSLVNPKIGEHRGRVVKNTGDGLLAEFSSVVDAVRCAVEVQRGMAERNAGGRRKDGLSSALASMLEMSCSTGATGSTARDNLFRSTGRRWSPNCLVVMTRFVIKSASIHIAGIHQRARL